MDKRVCLICDKNTTEDEKHFLVRCRTLEKVRKKYRPRLQLSDPVDVNSDPEEEEDEEEEEENDEENEEEKEKEESEEVVTRRMYEMFHVCNLKVTAEMIEEMQEERLKLMTHTLK